MVVPIYRPNILLLSFVTSRFQPDRGPAFSSSAASSMVASMTPVLIWAPICSRDVTAHAFSFVSTIDFWLGHFRRGACFNSIAQSFDSGRNWWRYVRFHLASPNLLGTPTTLEYAEYSFTQFLRLMQTELELPKRKSHAVYKIVSVSRYIPRKESYFLGFNLRRERLYVFCFFSSFFNFAFCAHTFLK